MNTKFTESQLEEYEFERQQQHEANVAKKVKREERDKRISNQNAILTPRERAVLNETILRNCYEAKVEERMENNMANGYKNNRPTFYNVYDERMEDIWGAEELRDTLYTFINDDD